MACAHAENACGSDGAASSEGTSSIPCPAGSRPRTSGGGASGGVMISEGSGGEERSHVKRARSVSRCLRFRGGLLVKAFVSLNSRLESNKEEEEDSRNTLHLAPISPLSLARWVSTSLSLHWLPCNTVITATRGDLRYSERYVAPLSSKLGTYKTISTKFWSQLPGENPLNFYVAPSSDRTTEMVCFQGDASTRRYLHCYRSLH